MVLDIAFISDFFKMTLSCFMGVRKAHNNGILTEHKTIGTTSWNK